MARRDEKPICEVLNRLFKGESSFILASDPFSRFDAENDNYILEIKVRHKDHNDVVMDYDKVQEIRRIAKEKGKRPIFIAAYKEHWKLTYLARKEDEIITRRTAKTTDFSNREMVIKEFARWKKADLIISRNQINKVAEKFGIIIAV